MKRRIRFEAGYDEGGGREFELRLTMSLSQPCIVHLVRITLLRCVRTKEAVRGLIRSLLTVAPKFINNLTWLNVEISFTKRVKQ